MDKTIQIVVVAMIALVTALIILFLVQGETDSFEGFLDNLMGDAEDEYPDDQIGDSEENDGNTQDQNYQEKELEFSRQILNA